MLFLASPSGEKRESSGCGEDTLLLWGLWGWAVHPGALTVFFSPHREGRDSAASCCHLTRTLCPLAAGLPQESWGDPHLTSALGNWIGRDPPRREGHMLTEG